MDNLFLASISNLPKSMQERAIIAYEKCFIENKPKIIEWIDGGSIVYWVLIEDDLYYSTSGHYSRVIKQRLERERIEFEADKVRDSVLAEANKLLKAEEIYDKYYEAIGHWIKLKETKTGQCQMCKEYFEKTLFHHLDKTLKPKERTWYGRYLYIPWATDKSILLGAKAVLNEFLKRLNDKEIERTIVYYSVTRDQLLEVCSGCHMNIHRYDKKKAIM
jgi:hypothetical protein